MLKQFAFTESKHVLTAGFGALLVLIVVVTLVGMSGIYAVNQRIGALLPITVVGVLVLIVGAGIALLVRRQIVSSEVALHRKEELAEEMAQQLTWQACHDALTGLINRREFERRLGDLIESVRTGGKQHALMYMDLDNFKTVNDICGYAAGDELLRQLTTVMQARMRGSDTLARIGGDEFGGVLASWPLAQA